MKTTSLQLSKELKANGYPQVAEFYLWTKKGDEERATLSRYTNLSLEYQHPDYQTAGLIFASPTADEILDKLPEETKDFQNGIKDNLWLEITKECNGEYKIFYKSNYTLGQAFYDIELANVAAKTWLYLKKENLL